MLSYTIAAPQIAFCHVHSSGALLLEQHDAGPTQEEQQYARDEQPMSPGGAEYDDAGTAEDDWQGHSNAGPRAIKT